MKLMPDREEGALVSRTPCRTRQSTLTRELLEGVDTDASPHAKSVATGAVSEAVKVAGGTDGALFNPEASQDGR